MCLTIFMRTLGRMFLSKIILSRKEGNEKASLFMCDTLLCREIYFTNEYRVHGSCKMYNDHDHPQ